MLSPRSALKWFIPAIIFMVLAFDGNTHWDENNYLGKAAYAPLTLKADWIQARGGFYTGRLFHIAVLRCLFFIFGIGLCPLIWIEFLMALCVLATGLIFYRVARMIGLNRREAFFTFLCFLFSPLSLYLGYKALAETSALFLAVLAVLCFLRALKSRNYFILSALALFLAAYCRVESLLAFGSLSLAIVLFRGSARPAGFRKLLGVLVVWGALTALTGLVFNLWAFRFLFARSRVFDYMMVRDRLDYPPNFFSALLFGGSLWVFIPLILFSLRSRFVRIGLAALILALIPLLFVYEHIELRYLNPVVFGFALCAGLGLNQLYLFLKSRMRSPIAVVLVVLLLAGAVGVNQLIRPLQEVGVEGIPLVRLINRLRSEYDDPLLITASVPNTYSFLRVCYPELRVAGKVLGDVVLPLGIRNYEDLARNKRPWFFLSTRGPKPVPLIQRLILRIQGKPVFPLQAQGNDYERQLMFPDQLSAVLMDEEGYYAVYRLREPDKYGL